MPFGTAVAIVMINSYRRRTVYRKGGISMKEMKFLLDTDSFSFMEGNNWRMALSQPPHLAGFMFKGKLIRGNAAIAVMGPHDLPTNIRFTNCDACDDGDYLC